MEIIESIKATLYERVSSPLFGAFSASWIVWNYKLPIVLMSDLGPMDKINIIRWSLYPWGFDSACSLVLLPLGSALIFIFGYPIPAFYIYRFWRKEQKKLADEKYKHDREMPIPAEKARLLHEQIFKLQIANDEKDAKQAEKLAKLEAELARSYGEAAEKDAEVAAGKRRAAESDEKDAKQAERLAILEAELARMYGEASEKDAIIATEQRRIAAFEDAVKSDREFKNRAQRTSAELPFDSMEARTFHRQWIEEVHRRSKIVQQRGWGADTPAIQEQMIVGTKWILYFNLDAQERGLKVVEFAANGALAEGRNDNEFTWRIVDGKLEFVRKDGKVNNRFFVDPQYGWLFSTGPNVVSRYQQVLAPLESDVFAKFTPH